MSRSKSSKRWLQEHHGDKYVKMAQQEGYPSRSAYKLLALQEKDHLFRPGMTVVDLGAAPGGWSMVAKKFIGEKGRVFALDILPMDSIEGVHFIQGDFTEEQVLNELLAQIKDQKIDVVLSDMAPNLSGMKAIDQPKAMYLAEIALEFALNHLTPKGIFLVKVFQGREFEAYLKVLRQHFSTVTTRKPDASRARSNEIYLLAKELIH